MTTDVCSLCLDELNSLDTITNACSYSDKHCFHKECIEKLVNSNLELRDKCPLCKNSLKNEYLPSFSAYTQFKNNHPTEHPFWRSFQFDRESESKVLEDISLSNDFTLFDELRNSKKVPSSEFNYSNYFQNSIFKQLIAKNEITRLTSLSLDSAYYPNDLDIVYCVHKGYNQIALNLINNQRFNPKFSDRTMLYIELQHQPQILNLYLDKIRYLRLSI